MGSAIRLRLFQSLRYVRDSYWALPGAIALACAGLGLGLVFVDTVLGDIWLGRYEWFYNSRPEGARAMLSTVAGSTITVAGVVFSVTLAAVTYASGRFGPRLLGTFTRDRGNQATLGIFIGTYLYCLVVLRTIRSAQEASAETGGAVRDAFVPQLAMFGGLALGVLSTAVLIYFVHHVTVGIHINTVIARVGESLLADVRDLADGPAEGPGRPPSPASRSTVHATEAGYIEIIDYEALVALAAERDLTMRVAPRPGDFVAPGRPLLHLSPAQLPDEPLKTACRAAFAVGRQRSSDQDPRFVIDELVEIAALALSPGVNDPFTAIGCIDWLGAAIGELASCHDAAAWHADDSGRARVHRNPLLFKDYLDAAFGQLWPYAAKDPNARRAMLDTLAAIARSATTHRALVEAERDRFEQGSQSR